MSKKRFDKGMAVVSALTPAAFLIYHLLKDKPEGKKWFRGAHSTPFSSALTFDLIFSSFVFLRLAKREIKAGRSKGPFWLYALINLCVGLSPAFPLLLLMSEEKES